MVSASADPTVYCESFSIGISAQKRDVISVMNTYCTAALFEYQEKVRIVAELRRR